MTMRSDRGRPGLPLRSPSKAAEEPGGVLLSSPLMWTRQTSRPSLLLLLGRGRPRSTIFKFRRPRAQVHHRRRRRVPQPCAGRFVPCAGRFVSDEGNYPVNAPLKETVASIQSQVAKIEDGMKQQCRGDGNTFLPQRMASRCRLQPTMSELQAYEIRSSKLCNPTQ